MIGQNTETRREITSLEEKERPETSRRRFRILVVADDSSAREALKTLLNEEPDFLVCGVVENVDQALEAMDKQYVDCVVVSLSKYSLAEEMELRHPYLALLTITPDDLCFCRNSSRRTIGGHVIGQEAAKRITGAANYVQTLLGSGIHGFVISSRLRWGMTHRLGFHNLQNT